MKKNLLNISILAVVGIAGFLTSCSEDFDFDEARRANPEFVYRENFEKAFGKIDPNQSWDFTDGKYHTISTRAEVDLSQYVNLDAEKETIGNATYWKNALKENEVTNHVSNGAVSSEIIDKASTGTPFNYISRGYFWICPVWRDKCEGEYTLQIIGTNPLSGDQTIYEQDFRTVMEAMVPKHKQDEETFTYGKPLPQGQICGGNMGWIIPFDAGTIITFALKNNLDKSISYNYHRVSVSLNKIKPYQACVTMDMGEKDKDGNVSVDKDFNELAFLVFYDSDDKEPEEVNTYKKIVNVSAKRYMVEDLGANEKSDIDFNDIVIDLKDRFISETDTKSFGSYSQFVTKVEHSQQAVIRALGGTKNLAVYLKAQEGAEEGDKCIFVKDKYVVADASPAVAPVYNTDYKAGLSNFDAKIMYNTIGNSSDKRFQKNSDLKYLPGSYLATVDLTELPEKNQWKPEQNNIYVKVYDNGLSGNVNDQSGNDVMTIPFPQDGEIPYMIAVEAGTIDETATSKDTEISEVITLGQKWNWEMVDVFSDLNPATGNFLKLTPSQQ